jgi:hypothetical protein
VQLAGRHRRRGAGRSGRHRDRWCRIGRAARCRRPFFEEDGIALHASPTPGRWLARARIFDGLATASIDRAVGYPISQWSPLGDSARPLRRLQNEMQMLLYTQRVNDDRAARGVPPINSFWLSGTGALKGATPAAAAPAAAHRP